MVELYKKKVQRRTITALLGGLTKVEGETIIETNFKAKDYLAKGHLSPDAAFVYNVMQDATYYFVNIAPQVSLPVVFCKLNHFQFQSINGGNWKALESDVRKLASK